MNAFFKRTPETSQAAQTLKDANDSYTMVVDLAEALENQFDPAARRMFSQWNVDGSIDRLLECSSPYPQYPSDVGNVAAANALSIDRQMVTRLTTEKKIDLEPMLQWISELSKRPEIRPQMHPEDEMSLAMALQHANSANASEAELIISKECAPILRRLMPDAFASAKDNLKKTVAQRLFRSDSGDETISPNQIALCSVSSQVMFQAITNTLMQRGHKAIMTVPFFNPLVDHLNNAGMKLVLPDTTRTGFKMRAQDLEQLIAQNKMGKDDWLVLTSPNNATIEPYTRKELQAIADVVAKTGIRVLCDELYAGFAAEPPTSLASLESWGPHGRVSMRDQVVTITGCSKQFPFGQESDRKLGIGFFSSPEEASQVQSLIDRSKFSVHEENADMYANLIKATPGRLRMQMRQLVDKDTAIIQETIQKVNAGILLSNHEPAITLDHGDGSYFACLSLSKTLCDKVGIQNGDDLMRYLLATTGFVTTSMRMEGVAEPMVRLNLNKTAPHTPLLQSRLEKLLTNIENGTAPSMKEINKDMDRWIAQPQNTQQTHMR